MLNSIYKFFNSLYNWLIRKLRPRVLLVDPEFNLPTEVLGAPERDVNRLWTERAWCAGMFTWSSMGLEDVPILLDRVDTTELPGELYSAGSGISEIHKVELLLKVGADPNQYSSLGNTPLHKAISIENLPVIKLLLVYGANLFIKNKAGKTPYDLSRGKTLIADLFSNDKDTNVKVRVQVCNHNLEKLKEKGMSPYLGNLDAYKVTEGVNDTVIKTGKPGSLKELCVERILNYIKI